MQVNDHETETDSESETGDDHDHENETDSESEPDDDHEHKTQADSEPKPDVCGTWISEEKQKEDPQDVAPYLCLQCGEIRDYLCLISRLEKGTCLCPNNHPCHVSIGNVLHPGSIRDCPDCSKRKRQMTKQKQKQKKQEQEKQRKEWEARVVQEKVD